MSGIACLVFTKNRAMQLYAFYESAARYAPYDSIQVCDSTGEKFEADVRGFLAGNERVVFHTDDDVWFRAPPKWLGTAAKYDGARSFRLGANTVLQHTTNTAQGLPYAAPQTTWFAWRWRGAEGDFGYPLSLNATVYRPADLFPLLDFHFANPTQLEAQLACNAAKFVPEWMTAPLHSCCVSIPLNRVTTDSRNPISDDPRWSAPLLQARYEMGYRLDLDAMDFTNIIGAHQVIEPRFRRV